MKSLKILTWVMLLAGIAGLTGLIAWQGVGEIAGTIAKGGWAMLLLALFFAPQCAIFAASWRLLFQPGREPSYPRVFGAMTVGVYANSLLPMADVGGEVIKARIVMKGGISGADAGASVVLDKTIQTITLICWAIIGILTLVALKVAGPALYAGLIITALLTLGVAGFIVVQHKGMFGGMAGFAGRIAGGDKWAKIAGGARALDLAIRELYRRRGRLAASSAIRLFGRFVLVGEVWLAAQLIGQPIGVLEALALRSLGLTIRSAAFLVPGGYGIQEGGYVAVGALIGIPPDTALVLSLATRIRDIVVGVPALVAWQWSEGRAIRRNRTPRRNGATSETNPATGGDR